MGKAEDAREEEAVRRRRAREVRIQEINERISRRIAKFGIAAEREAVDQSLPPVFRQIALFRLKRLRSSPPPSS